mmetsp:Transcript_50262/g.104917  ORF Transcript_50262/g.104917 Transcript_50262/m.104917 type:complete len:126 (-) Transcript_50262:743-1120(-)
MSVAGSNGCSSTLSRCFGDQSNSVDARPTQAYEPNSSELFRVTASLGQPATDGSKETLLRQGNHSEQRDIAYEMQPRNQSTSSSVSRPVLNVSVREEMSSNSAATSPVELASAKSQVRSAINNLY